MRREPAWLAWLVLSALATGSPGGKGADSGGSTAQPAAKDGSGGPSTAARKLHVGLVLDTGGVDDRSFNAAANAGLEQAEQASGVDGKYVESITLRTTQPT